MIKRKKVPLNPWETAKKADEADTHYSRYGDSLLDSPKFCRLKYTTRLLYLYMIRAAAGKRVVTFPCSFYEKRGVPKTKAINAINEL